MGNISYVDTFDTSHWDISKHGSLRTPLCAASLVAITLLIPLAVARAYARRLLRIGLQWDDYLIFLATLCTIVLCTIAIAATTWELGSHIWDIKAVENTEQITKLLFGVYLSYTTAMALTKFSIIASLRNIFLTRNLDRPKFRILMLCIAAVVFCHWIASFFGILFECLPIDAQWIWTKPRKCVNILAFFQATSAINFATDVGLVILPLVEVCRLHMTKNLKTRLFLLFGVASFACFASAARLALLEGLVGSDITYTSVIPLILSIVEVCIGIVCASIPPLKPLYDPLLPKSWRSFHTYRPTPPPTISRPQTGISDRSAKDPYGFGKYGVLGIGIDSDYVPRPIELNQLRIPPPSLVSTSLNSTSRASSVAFGLHNSEETLQGENSRPSLIQQHSMTPSESTGALSLAVAPTIYEQV